MVLVFGGHLQLTISKAREPYTRELSAHNFTTGTPWHSPPPPPPHKHALELATKMLHQTLVIKQTGPALPPPQLLHPPISLVAIPCLAFCHPTCPPSIHPAPLSPPSPTPPPSSTHAGA